MPTLSERGLRLYHHGDLRQALVSLAVDVLSSSGVEELSLRAMARDLGVSHAAPLRHFKTKVDLLSAVAVEGTQALLSNIANSRGPHSGAMRLLEISKAYIDWALDNPAYYKVLRNSEVMRHAPSILRRMIADFTDELRAELAAAQAAGWKPDEKPEDLLFHFTVLTVGAAVVTNDELYARPNNIVSSRDRLHSLVETFLGLREENASQRSNL